MSSLFRRAAQSIKTGPGVVPMFLVFLTMFTISLGTGYEDITTSYLGYLAIPTQKANLWVAYLVALIPSVGSIGFLYLFMDNPNKSWAFWVAALLHLADIYTDVAWKAAGGGVDVIVLAFAEAEIIYTLGSEAMFTVSIGMLITLAPDFLKQIKSMWGMMRESGLADAIRGSFVYRGDEDEVDNEDDDPPGFPAHARFVNGGDPRRQQQSRPNLPADRPRP